MTIDFTKSIQTRNGLTARIVSTNLHGMCPIAAVVDRGDGYEYVAVYTDKGAYYAAGVHDSDLDLINVPVKHEAWINIYHNEHGGCPWVCTYQTKEEADYKAAPERIACVRIEYEIGDGL